MHITEGYGISYDLIFECVSSYLHITTIQSKMYRVTWPP